MGRGTRPAPGSSGTLSEKPSRTVFALGLVLAAAAGGVDSLGWITLDRVFTAHMSGNTVYLMVHVASGDWGQVLQRAAVIADFIVGLVAGAIVVTVAHHRRPGTRFVYALAVEAMLLVILLVASELLTHGAPLRYAPTAGYFLLLALPSLAMGIQSATIHRVVVAHARTTFITGILAHLVENIVLWGTLVWERRRGGHQRRDKEATAKQRVVVHASLWMLYATGGIVAALLGLRVAMRAFALPLALLFVAIALDRWLARAGVSAASLDEA